jgi:hypothetical protein
MESTLSICAAFNITQRQTNFSLHNSRVAIRFFKLPDHGDHRAEPEQAPLDTADFRLGQRLCQYFMVAGFWLFVSTRQ